MIRNFKLDDPVPHPDDPRRFDQLRRPTTLPDMIREAHRRGLKVSNLFELIEGGWRANVRNGDEYDFHDAETPEAALRGAIDKAAATAVAATPAVAAAPNFLD